MLKPFKRISLYGLSDFYITSVQITPLGFIKHAFEKRKEQKKKICPVINNTLSKCVPHVNKTPECAEDGQHTCVVFHQLL